MNLKGFTQLTCSQSHLWGEKATLGLFLVHFLDDWPVRASKWCRYRASHLKPKSLCKGTVKLKLFYTVTTDLVWAVRCSAATTAIFLLCHKNWETLSVLLQAQPKCFTLFVQKHSFSLARMWKESCIQESHNIKAAVSRLSLLMWITEAWVLFEL